MNKKADESYLMEASEVSRFLWGLQQGNENRVPETIPEADFAYGEALNRWDQNGKDPEDFFSTDDPWFIEFRTELQAEFGLQILTSNEAKEKHQRSPVNFRVRAIDGFGGPFCWGMGKGEA